MEAPLLRPLSAFRREQVRREVLVVSKGAAQES